MEIKRNYTSNIVAFVYNIALVYVAYAICRIEYLLENWSLFSESFFRNSWTDILTGCWMFDTSAILYTNVIYAAYSRMAASSRSGIRPSASLSTGTSRA